MLSFSHAQYFFHETTYSLVHQPEWEFCLDVMNNDISKLFINYCVIPGVSQISSTLIWSNYLSSQYGLEECSV